MDEGKQQAFELGLFRLILKDKAADVSPVHGAILAKSFRAKSSSNGFKALRSRQDDVMGDDVTVDDAGAKFSEHGHYRTLPRRNSAGQSDMKHNHSLPLRAIYFYYTGRMIFCPTLPRFYTKKAQLSKELCFIKHRIWGFNPYK